MRPVPRSYYDIKGKPDEHLWMEACDKEIKILAHSSNEILVHDFVTTRRRIPPANSSLPSRHHPLCRLHFPSARAILCDSLKEGWDLFLVPGGWVRMIQLSVMKRVGISSDFSLLFSPGQLMIIGCGVSVSSPHILSFPLPASLKKSGMVMAVSPWYLVA